MASYLPRFAPLALLLFTAISYPQAPISAHSGGTNGDGCHNNRKTGDYHCHNSGRSNGGSTTPTYSPPSSYNTIERPASVTPKTDPGYVNWGNKIPSSPYSQRLPQVGYFGLVSVGDGDTIRVRDSQGQLITVRLACIDAPELRQGSAGKHAQSYLNQLLANHEGQLRLNVIDKDRYGRTVAEVIVSDININLAMVRMGHAFVYRDYLSGCNGPKYVHEEFGARSNRYGVWSSNIQYPWDYRRNKR